MSSCGQPAAWSVADDIMETFDEFRAEDAFRLFTDMAQTGQPIYLTYHQHLCEIARRVCLTVECTPSTGLPLSARLLEGSRQEQPQFRCELNNSAFFR